MTTLLELRGVTKRFGELTAVDDVSFSVADDSVVALIGPNGAGKTTTLDMIAGSVTGWTGDIMFDGRPLGRPKAHSVARGGIARTFQIAQPFRDMSVVENVMVGALFGRRERAPVAVAARQAMGVLEGVGLIDRADEPSDQLSAPERKRLEIAKALSMRPRLVLMDELMAGLTAAEVDVVIDLVRDLRAGGLAFLMVEHVMRAVSSLADHVVMLDLGRKVAEGTASDVLGHESVISAYLGRRATVPTTD